MEGNLGEAVGRKKVVTLILILFFVSLTVLVGKKLLVKSENIENLAISKSQPELTFEEKTNDEGGSITVQAQPLSGLGSNNPEGDIIFDFSIDTHSVDIMDFDIFANVKLVSGDASQPPKDWQEGASSIHHKSGKLVFRHYSKLGKNLELLVTDLGEVKERRIKWEL